MLGFAPFAALPLAAVELSAIAAIEEQLSASGTITFSGSGVMGAQTPMTASGTVTFAGSGFVRIEVYSASSGAITFGGSPALTVAGRPLVFTAIRDSFEFRADGADFEFITLSASFDFRGVPE